MKIVIFFFRAWLVLFFVLVYFFIPFYLIAIYPDIPEPAVRIARSAGYGLIKGDPSPLSFWYRFTACGAWVLMGLLLVWRYLRPGKSDINKIRKTKKNGA